MTEANSFHREQINQLQAQAVSSATQLRLEFLQAENRLQHQEDALRSAGEALSIWRVGGPQPLSIWRPPCPFGGLGVREPCTSNFVGFRVIHTY